MCKKHKALLAALIITCVLIADQAVKIAVKTHMCLGDSIDIAPWFKLHFIENNGMAFGWELGGKYFLTSFRLAAIVGIAIYLVNYLRQPHAKTFLVVCTALILAGAAGNVIDCLFYGMVFNNPPYPEVAQFVPWGTGYSSLMLGRVVDMLYFPLLEWDMPAWPWLSSVPFLPGPGEHCVFFSPVFNIADAAVSVAIILLFGYFLFAKPSK